MDENMLLVVSFSLIIAVNYNMTHFNGHIAKFHYFF